MVAETIGWEENGVSQMKMTTSLLSILLLTVSLVAPFSAKTAEGFILKEELTSGSYCYSSLPAIQRESLGTDEAFLKRPESGSATDFYDRCDESPVKQRQVTKQRQDREGRSEQRGE